jgi:hypothetical protein
LQVRDPDIGIGYACVSWFGGLVVMLGTSNGTEPSSASAHNV